MQIKKNYVSFHLTAVCYHPELLDGINEPLKKRMQGKSYSNFNASNVESFQSLANLTRRSFDLYKRFKKV